MKRPKILSPLRWGRRYRSTKIGIRRAYNHARKGWDPSDTWSLDSHLLKIMVPLLETLRDNAYGYPSRFDNFQEWEAILNEIIDGLQAGRDCINGLRGDDFLANQARFRHSWNLMGEYFFDLWD